MRYGRAQITGAAGTRLRLYPQAPFLAGYATPETVTLSPPAGSVSLGPADERMYTLWPAGKPHPYGLVATPARCQLYLPPWNGPILAPARPDRQGHFDRIPVNAPEFELAHAYGAARFVLDIWEGYLGHPVHWHFSQEIPQLEISIFHGFANSRAGYGFLELGSERGADGKVHPFALNFDVVAHELGHLIIYSAVGLPDPIDDTGDYYGFQESGADIISLLAAAHFASVVEEMFAQTRGNINALNRLNRFAELSSQEQIRVACNDVRLRRFAHGWIDEHDLSLPLTGCLFDILVDIFHEMLLERGLIEPAVEDLLDRIERNPAALPVIQSLFDRAYPPRAAAFHDAFADARDHLGRSFGIVLGRLRGASVTYARIIEALLAIDREQNCGRFARLIRSNALWRDIGRVQVGPRIGSPNPESHSASARTLTPDTLAATHRPPVRGRHRAARGWRAPPHRPIRLRAHNA
jgi:hypothetical protein